MKVRGRGDAIPTYNGVFRGDAVPIYIRRYGKEWVFENLDFVKQLFPHLNYIDIDDVDFRIQGKHAVIVAERDGTPLGFTIWYETVRGVAYIWLTGVCRDFRGRGIGTQLLRCVVGDIQREGMVAAWCKISKEKRGWIRRHLSMGFRVFEHFRENGTDLYKLVKMMGNSNVVVL